MFDGLKTQIFECATGQAGTDNVSTIQIPEYDNISKISMLVAYDANKDLYAMFGLMIEDDDGNVLCEEKWCQDAGDAKWEDFEVPEG